jgi:hypothetical protein
MSCKITQSLAFVIKKTFTKRFICSYIKISHMYFICGHQQLVFVHSTSVSSQNNITHHQPTNKTLEQDGSKTCLVLYCVVTSRLSPVCRNHRSLTWCRLTSLKTKRACSKEIWNTICGVYLYFLFQLEFNNYMILCNWLAHFFCVFCILYFFVFIVLILIYVYVNFCKLWQML